MALSFNKVRAVDAVIERKLLPAHVHDYGQLTHGFTDWRWHSFQLDPASMKLVGKVSAKRLSDNLIIWCNLVIYQDDVERMEPTQLFQLIDLQMKAAIDFIVNYEKPHTPGVLCRNNFCEECYR